MTRLFYLHNIAMPGPEANTVNVAKMCGAFAANGMKVTLAALPGVNQQSDIAESIRTHYDVTGSFRAEALPMIARRPSAAAMIGVALARKRGADLLYSRAPHAVLAACAAGIPAVLEMHNPPGAFSALGRAAYRRLLHHPRLVGIVCISHALAEHLGQDAHDRPLIVAHDGADEPASPPSARHSTRLQVGFAGRFYRGKGLELISELARLCPWADFHVVGGDAAEAAPLLDKPPPCNTTFWGSVPHASVRKHVEQWDVALAPYQRAVIVADGMTNAARWMSPLKLFEYMSAAKAIVASDLPVLREVLTDKHNSLLLPPDDAPMWAAALAALRDDPGLRHQLGARAYGDFCAHFTWRQRARIILESLGMASRMVALSGEVGDAGTI